MQWWWYFMGKGKGGVLFFFPGSELCCWFLHVEKFKKERNAHKLFFLTWKSYNKVFVFHQEVILEFLFGSVGRRSRSAQPSRKLDPFVCVTGHLCVVMFNYSGFLSIVSNPYPRVKHRMCSDVEILFTSPSVYVIYCFCCLATKSCPILCDSVDWRLLCPQDFPGKNTGVACHFFLQGIFLTQGLNPHLLHWQAYSTTELPGKPLQVKADAKRYNLQRFFFKN